MNFTIEVAQECGDSPTETTLNHSFNEGVSHPQLQGSLSEGKLSAIQQPPSPPAYHPPFRTVGIKWPVGFQPEIVCQQIGNEPMPTITSLTHSSSYGL